LSDFSIDVFAKQKKNVQTGKLDDYFIVGQRTYSNKFIGMKKQNPAKGG
jgi:hypothetical protein